MFPPLGIKPNDSEYNTTGSINTSIGRFDFKITGNPGLEFRVRDNIISNLVWIYPAVTDKGKEVKICIGDQYGY